MISQVLQIWHALACFQGQSEHDPLKFSEIERGHWPVSCDAQNFGALNANCSNMVECTDFKIDKHAPSDSPDIIPYKISEKWERSESRDP